MMYFLVNFVGLLVFIYALGYMQGDVRVDWFFAAFSLFAGAMLVLVAAPNLVQLIIGWEGVGLASYFLIGFYWEDLENVKAGNKAFMTNKVADVGLILGAIILGVTLGTFDFAALDRGRVRAQRGPGSCRGGRRRPALLRGYGQERPVPVAHLAPRCHGRPHAGVGPHARGDHGHRGCVPDGPCLPTVPELADDSAGRGWSRSGRSPSSPSVSSPWWPTTSRRCSPTRRCHSWVT